MSRALTTLRAQRERRQIHVHGRADFAVISGMCFKGAEPPSFGQASIV